MLPSPAGPAEAPCEWMRAFALRLAQRRPDISADEAVRLAIRAFQTAGHLPPERAANAPTAPMASP